MVLFEVAGERHTRVNGGIDRLQTTRSPRW